MEKRGQIKSILVLVLAGIMMLTGGPVKAKKLKKFGLHQQLSFMLDKARN